MALKFGIEVDDKGTPKVVKFKKSIKDTEKASFNAEKALKGFAGGIGALGAGAVGVTGAMFAMSKSFAESQDKIRKMGRELGLSTEFLSSMQFSAKLAGTELEVVDKAMAKVGRQALDAQNGLQTAKRAFDDLGIATKNQDGTFKELDEIVFEVADKFKEMPDGVLKVAKAQEIFGKSGKKMINLLNQGSEAIKEQAEEARSLGIVFDNETAERAELFNDTLFRLQETFRGFFQETANDLIPMFTDGMSDLQKEFIQAKPVLIEFAKDGTQLLGKMIPVMTDLVSLGAKLANQLNNFNKIDFSDVGADLEEGLSDKLKNAIANQKELDKIAEESKKRNEKLEKQQQKIEQQRKLRKRNQELEAEKRQKKEAERTKANEEREAKRSLENDKKEAQKKLENKKAVEREITLLLLDEFSQREFLAEEAHQKRIEMGADQVVSAQILSDQLKQIQQEEHDHGEALRKAKKEQEKADAEEKRRLFEENLNYFIEGFQMASQTMANINQTEQNLINERFDKRKTLVEAQFEEEIAGAEGSAEAQEEIRKKRDDKLRELDNKRSKQLEQAQKKNAGLRKSIAIADAVTNGAVAVTKMWAVGGLAGPILAGLASAMTASQVALIASQKYYEGGMIKGKDTLISTNENGTESVLNARATSAVGEDALNDFNSGRTQDALDKIQSSIGVGSSKGITINISGGVVDRRFAEEQLIPMIQKTMRTR